MGDELDVIINLVDRIRESFGGPGEVFDSDRAAPMITGYEYLCVSAAMDQLIARRNRPEEIRQEERDRAAGIVRSSCAGFWSPHALDILAAKIRGE